MGIPAIKQKFHNLTLTEVFTPFLKRGLISAAQVDKYVTQWAHSFDHPVTLVLSLPFKDPRTPDKLISQDDLLGILAVHWNIAYQRVDPLKIPMETVGSLLPYPYVERLGIVPVEVLTEKVVIVTANPLDLSWVEEVKRQVKRPVEVRLSSPKQIAHLLSEIFIVQKAFKAMAREDGVAGAQKFRLLKEGKIEELEQLVEKSRARSTGQDGYVAKIVDWFISYAANERASDIHFEPKKGLGVVRFRVDGDLRTVYRLDHQALMMVVSRFKILADMKLDEKRKPQDGGIKHTLRSGQQVEMRLSTLPTNYGEKLVVRIFDKAVAGQDLDFIGFSPEDLKTWNDLISQPQGLILVTGPTGSGKTTTLYTTLNKVATPDVNVCTAEDPIEMEVDAFNQVQVNPQIGLSFADCIRTFMRQDPDIIMVGEIRDLDTGEMAIQSSLTGHLVFSTLHTNGALATIQRLLDLGLPSFLINSALTGILAQRLVKKLCSHCKVKVPTDKDLWNLLLDGAALPMPSHVYEAKGCDECKHTGYTGRLCIYELVKMTDSLKKNIHAKIEIAELKERTKGSFVSIRINGARKVLAGETSIEEILKVVY